MRKLVCLLALAFTHVVGIARAQEAGGQRQLVFKESLERITNPERGFYAPRFTHRLRGLEDLRKQGISLALLEMDLRDFKERELSQEKLDELRQAFVAVRKNGLKAIFRAAYGFTGRDYRADPKDMERILSHIRQLGTVFGEHRDVLFCVQAGFLGPWGEWHGSNWGDPPALAARRQVLFGLLDAVPSPIPVQVRRPMFIRDIFEKEPGGSSLTEKTAYSGSRLARTGWHNDAVLSLPTDMGTYAERGWDRKKELEWCNIHGRYAPFGGESVGPSAKTSINQAVRELEMLHATYLNMSYHPQTLQAWRTAEYRGENAFQHIERRLGYRLVVERLRTNTSVQAGGELSFELELKNVGFASPQLPHEVAVVLIQGKRVLRQVLKEADPRRWNPEAGTIRLSGRLAIPADTPAGAWDFALHLADPSPSLSSDGRYAIRLANQNIEFEDSTGWNRLTKEIMISGKKGE